MTKPNAKKSTSTSSKKHAVTTSPATPPVETSSSAAATLPLVPTPTVAPTDPKVTPIDATVVTQCIALLDQVGGLLGPVPQLSADEIRRSLKLRKGGAQVIQQLLTLCTQHKVTTVGPVTVQAMTQQLDRANALNQIGVQLDAVQKKLTDAAFSAESVSWQNATALYTVLVRLALMDPTLATGLQPVQAFFQTKTTKGTKRAKTSIKKAQDATEKAAKYAPPASESTAPAAANSGSSTTGASSASNGAAQAASGNSGGATSATAAPVTNGASH